MSNSTQNILTNATFLHTWEEEQLMYRLTRWRLLCKYIHIDYYISVKMPHLCCLQSFKSHILKCSVRFQHSSSSCHTILQTGRYRRNTSLQRSRETAINLRGNFWFSDLVEFPLISTFPLCLKHPKKVIFIKSSLRRFHSIGPRRPIHRKIDGGIF